MINAKDEFKNHVERRPRIIAVEILKDDFEVLLKVGYSKEEYLKFLDSLDFLYDSGYGGRELYGTIWYEDGSWSGRGEYDGSEWGTYKITPIIPNKLQGEKD